MTLTFVCGDARPGMSYSGIRCKGCGWACHDHTASPARVRLSSQHPWDALLETHIRSQHGVTISRLVEEEFTATPEEDRIWDVYMQGIAIRKRQGFPAVGCSVDRRAFDHTQQLFNNDTVRSLICSVCARIRVDTGGIRSHIEFCKGGWFLTLPNGSLKKNFSMSEFRERYCQPGTPLACNDPSLRAPQFDDWYLQLHPDVWGHSSMYSLDVLELRNTRLLCCPEDHKCSYDCVSKRLLCPSCELPVCID